MDDWGSSAWMFQEYHGSKSDDRDLENYQNSGNHQENQECQGDQEERYLDDYQEYQDSHNSQENAQIIPRRLNGLVDEIDHLSNNINQIKVLILILAVVGCYHKRERYKN